MCGRARLSSDVSEIKLVFRIPPERPMPNIAPSWNVAPTDPLRWGLVPFWAKDIKYRSTIFMSGKRPPPASSPTRSLWRTGS